MNNLIEWHRERARELNAEADGLECMAQDKRSSHWTRKEKMERVNTTRRHAQMHTATVEALRVSVPSTAQEQDCEICAGTGLTFGKRCICMPSHGTIDGSGE